MTVTASEYFISVFFILFGVCVCVCGSFGASDVILILMVRLGPCPGINVIGKTGRALNVESRWGIEIPPQTLQTPILWDCSSQKQFWRRSCFCWCLFLHCPRRSSGCCFWRTSWWCCWRWSQIYWWPWFASCSAQVSERILLEWMGWDLWQFCRGRRGASLLICPVEMAGSGPSASLL